MRLFCIFGFHKWSKWDITHVLKDNVFHQKECIKCKVKEVKIKMKEK